MGAVQNSASKNHPRDILHDENNLYGIKTHGSDSCGQESWHTTSSVYLQEERKCSIHTYVAPCSLLELESFLCCKRPPPSAPHVPNLSKIA